jgi:hypothetical protein
VEIVGPDGPAASCVAGEELRLRLAYQAAEGIADPVFAVAFHHETGALVTSTTTRATGDQVAVAQGVGRVDYVQDPCRLNPGNYRVDVSVLDASGTHIFDTWTDALTLVVRSGKGTAKGGLVNLPDCFDTARVTQPDGAGHG